MVKLSYPKWFLFKSKYFSSFPRDLSSCMRSFTSSTAWAFGKHGGNNGLPRCASNTIAASSLCCWWHRCRVGDTTSCKLSLLLLVLSFFRDAILAPPVSLGCNTESHALVVSDLRAALTAHDVATILTLNAVLVPLDLFLHRLVLLTLTSTRGCGRFVYFFIRWLLLLRVLRLFTVIFIFAFLL